MSSNMPSQPDPDQCALDKNGQLKDAKDITFFHSPSDKSPIPLPPMGGETERLAQIIEVWLVYSFSFGH